MVDDFIQDEKPIYIILTISKKPFDMTESRRLS